MLLFSVQIMSILLELGPPGERVTRAQRHGFFSI